MNNLFKCWELQDGHFQQLSVVNSAKNKQEFRIKHILSGVVIILSKKHFLKDVDSLESQHVAANGG